VPSLGDMVVRIVGDNAQFDTAIDKSHAKFEKFAKDTVRIGKNLTKFVTLPILGAAAAIVKMASDAQETQAKFNTAFRDVRAQADATAKSLADNYGLSNVAAKRLLSTTGDLLKGFGATGGQALDLSDKVQKLAVDLASYNNIQGGAERASAILTRALLGEREALTSLGVKVSQAQIDTILLANGQKELEGRALLLATAQATLQSVVEQSTDAMGDFARTQDSVANQMRTVAARASDVAVQFGEILLPAVADILGKVGDFTQKISELDDRQKRLILSILGVAAAIGPAIFIVGKLITTFIALKGAVIALNAALLSNPILAALAAVGLLAAGIGLLIVKYQELKREIEEVNEGFSTQLDLIDQFGGENAIRAIEREIELLKTVRAERQELITLAGENVHTKIALLDLDEQIAAKELKILEIRGKADEAAIQAVINLNAELLKLLRGLDVKTVADRERIALLETEIDRLAALRTAARERAAANKVMTEAELEAERLRIAALEAEAEAELELKNASIAAIKATRKEALAAARERTAFALAGAQERTAADVKEAKKRSALGIEEARKRTDAELEQEAILAAAAAASLAMRRDALKRLGELRIEAGERAAAAIEESRKKDAANAAFKKAEAKAEFERLAVLRQDAATMAAESQRRAAEGREEAAAERRSNWAEEREGNLDVWREKLKNYQAEQQVLDDIQDQKDQDALDELYRIERERDAWLSVGAQIVGIFTNIGRLQSALSQNQIDRLDAQMQKEIDAGHNRETVEENYQAARADLEYDGALNSWRINVASSIAAGALAILNAMQLPPPFGFISAGLATIAAGVQIAAVAASRPVPALAAGGIVQPSSGGTLARVAEAGQAEVIFPLDRLNDFLDSPPTGLGGDGEGEVHLVVNIDSKPILDSIFPASRNRTVLIDARAIV
jgi:hypothetical protein